MTCHLVVDPAAFVVAVAHGMMVQAKEGFSHDMLRTVAKQGLTAWPDSEDAPTAVET